MICITDSYKTKKKSNATYTSNTKQISHSKNEMSNRTEIFQFVIDKNWANAIFRVLPLDSFLDFIKGIPQHT